MIAHLHTAEHGFVIGTDHIPRIGEKIRIPSEPNIPDERDGWYMIQDVVYEVPNNPGRQRVDIYAQKLAVTPSDLSYKAVSEADYRFKLDRA